MSHSRFCLQNSRNKWCPSFSLTYLSASILYPQEARICSVHWWQRSRIMGNSEETKRSRTMRLTSQRDLRNFLWTFYRRNFSWRKRSSGSADVVAIAEEEMTFQLFETPAHRFFKLTAMCRNEEQSFSQGTNPGKTRIFGNNTSGEMKLLARNKP